MYVFTNHKITTLQPRDCNSVFLVKKSYYNVCVGVQFYPWFKSYFPWFWCMVMYNNEFETKENKI